MRIAAILNLLVGGLAVRHRRKATAAWESVTSPEEGPCASHFGRADLFTRPLSLPVLCSGEVEDVIVSVAVDVWWINDLTFTVNGDYRGKVSTPRPGTWNFTVGSLSDGLNYIGMKQGMPFAVPSPGFSEISAVKMAGSGAACSFTDPPAGKRDASVYTYKGFDSMYRLFNQVGDFPAFQKNDLYFVSETVGRTSDGSIDASVVSEGFYKWVIEYSQKQPAHDQWGHRGTMWNESLLTPWPEARLDNLPRHTGQKMVVQEPCNALSSYAFHQCAVWISCKGYPFERDEMASLIAAFNGLSAGTIFQHACACNTGGRADTFTMDWLIMQIHQSALKQVISNAGDSLTEEERTNLLTFGKGVGKITDLAKDMTRMFEEKYDHANWNRTMRAVDIPDFMFPITGFIAFVLWSLQGLIDHGTEVILDAVLKTLVDAFDVPDAEFWTDVYSPTVRKALSFSNICPEAVKPVVEYTVKFILTFVEALVYQEQTLPVPDAIKDVFRILDSWGMTHELYTDMEDTWDYYNGKDCLARSDHAVWHEKAAHGLVHFLNVAEYYRTSVGC